MQVLQDIDLSQILYYKIGGKVKTVLEITTLEDFKEALEYLKQHPAQKIVPLGLGSNVLISSTALSNATVLWFSPKKEIVELGANNQVKSFAATHMDEVIKFAFEHNLVGLEWAGGLPTTVGAAVRGSVGAFGGEIKDSIVRAEVVDLTDSRFSIKQLSNADLQFGYRDSLIKQNNNFAVISATFQLHPADQQQLWEAQEQYDEHIAYRQKNHPMEYPSCGSVFKNIVQKEKVEKIYSIWSDVKELSETRWHNKVSMGYIIDRLGFTGKRIGDAQVSEKHSNYIVNLGGATFEDVYSIINEIKETFKQTFGFYPEQEVEIID